MNSHRAASVRLLNLLNGRTASIPSLGKARLHFPASENGKASQWFGWSLRGLWNAEPVFPYHWPVPLALRGKSPASLCDNVTLNSSALEVACVDLD